MEQRKIILCKGLPASGKSTYAKNLCAEDLSWRRVNKDEIRAGYNTTWSHEIEKKVLQQERSLGLFYLSNGYNLIVDSTNFNPQHESYWRNVAETEGYDFEVRFFDVSLKECLERDSKRENPVGERVIKRMYNQYIKPTIKKSDKRIYLKQDETLPKAIIVDIDGTLALMNDRSPYDFKAVINDLPNKVLFDVIKDLSVNSKIILLSGREEKARELTEAWLKKHQFPDWEMLLMRSNNDYRSDDIIKEEIFNSNIRDRYYIVAVFDDRDKVVKMWREKIGLLCLQVYYGDF